MSADKPSPGGSSPSGTAHQVERWTGRVLRAGVLGSAFVLCIGICMALLRPRDPAGIASSMDLASLAARLASGSLDARTILFIGLVILMVTPIVRVVTAVAGFAAERDWRFVIVSGLVFILLAGEIIYSLHIPG